MTTQEIHDVELSMLVPHPLNRTFPTTGKDWREFVESIRIAGRILVPLHVRDLGDGTYQILAGHRRAAGAREACGITEVPCLIHQMEDDEALEFLVNENLQRLDLSPVDEARLLAAMRDELRYEEHEIAARISRTVSWVRVRQLMLDLGDEVLTAVQSPEPESRLTLGAVEEILRCPEELRPEAVQLVLHPDFQEAPLDAATARDILRKCLIEPRRAEKAWDTALPKTTEAWKKRLRKLLGKAASEGLSVIGIPYTSATSEARFGLPAEDRVPDHERSSSAPENLLWIHLAIRHGLAVKILPGEAEESRALIDARLIRIAEAARAEHGEEAWLLTNGRETATPAEKARTQAALAVLEGQGETVYQSDDEDDGPPPEQTTTQSATLQAWCDLTPVKKLAFWAIDETSDPKTAPDFVPEWARDLAFGGYWTTIDAITAWVLTLRKKD